MSRETKPPDAAALHAPLARLLRPLVRLMIRSGITFPAAAELLRELYVNVAEHDFALSSKGQTDSRVSLLTGIHRKEVRRLRGAGAPVTAVPASLSQTSRILARWLGDPAFADEAGQPLALPRVAEAGRPSFESLVALVTRDVRPRAVLDEWIDRGMVTIGTDGRLTLGEAAFVPAGDDGQLYYFGRNLHDHMAASVANVEGRQPAFFERAVHYDGLTREAAMGLEQRSRQLASRALQTANRDAHAATAAGEEGSWRWNFGVYIYAEPEDDSASGTAASGTAGEGA